MRIQLFSIRLASFVLWGRWEGEVSLSQLPPDPSTWKVVPGHSLPSLFALCVRSPLILLFVFVPLHAHYAQEEPPPRPPHMSTATVCRNRGLSTSPPHGPRA